MSLDKVIFSISGQDFTIAELFETDGIVIAYPQQDVHLDGNITLLSQK